MNQKTLKLGAMATVLSMTVLLSGCNYFDNEVGKMRAALKGREATISTYDQDSHIIDRITGKSISIGADGQFDLKDSNGATVQKSDVIGFTVGGSSVTHVGSSMVLAEKGLTNVFEEFAKTVNVENMDRSTPFINRLVNDMKNLTTGKKKVILIRSQSGKPLATYVGDSVSYFATDINKSTAFLVDGKYLFIYRCDYTVYDSELLAKQ